jgi:putative membrane protein
MHSIFSEEHINVTILKKESLRLQLDRSAILRSNFKRYYIYVVLALIVFIFSVVKLDMEHIDFFGRGHFLSPDSLINLLRSAVPILTLSGAFTLLMISGHIDLSVGSAMSLTAVVFALMILNGFSFLPAFLLSGFVCIRNRKVDAHRACMAGAVLTSVLFLASYLTYHAQVGSVRFTAQGLPRSVYFAVLISHTILAVATLPLVLRTLYLGLKRRDDRHRRIARWTLPIWLYVSVTGVVVYVMLYHIA